MKTKTWIGIFALLLIVCAVAAVALRSGEDGDTAEIYSQGELVATVNLARADSFSITTDAGENHVVIADGQIYVDTASCPDQVCVAHGAASSGNPIVCLPNRLVISLVGGDLDASTGS